MWKPGSSVIVTEDNEEIGSEDENSEPAIIRALQRSETGFACDLVLEFEEGEDRHFIRQGASGVWTEEGTEKKFLITTFIKVEA